MQTEGEIGTRSFSWPCRGQSLDSDALQTLSKGLERLRLTSLA